MRTARVDASYATARLEPRVTRIESQLTNLVDDVAGLRDTLRDHAAGVRLDIDRLATAFNESRRTNWQTLIPASFLILTLFGAGMMPAYLSIGYNRDAVAKLEDWQSNYQFGKIPSPDEPKLATITEHQAEIETQFHSFRDRMIENERYTMERLDMNNRHIEELASTQIRSLERLARLEERLHTPSERDRKE